MTNKKKNVILTLGIVLLVIIIAGGTYAYLLINANVTNAAYIGETACFDIDYSVTNDDGTLPITGTLFPSYTAKGGLSGKVTMNINSSCDADGFGTINLNVTSADNILLQTVDAHCEDSRTLMTLSEYTTSDDCLEQRDTVWVTDGNALKYAVYVNDEKFPVSVGYVDKTGTIEIHNRIRLLHELKSFYIYIWLDGEISDNSYANLSFDGYIDSIAEYIHNYPNEPVLDDGMIPVTISNTGIVTTVSKNDPSWYDYDNKEWANVVLVKETGTQLRSYYKNNPGITVNQDDILAYYVWIPRYKYQIWTTTTTTNPQTINIEFEDKSAPKSSGTNVGDYITHPAFIWDGDTVAGIWVGKFETSHSTLASSTTNNNLGCTNENCANADGLIIKPNVISLRNNNVSNFFFASRSMTRSGNPFGLTTVTDSHMMKNSEWGAVAYLSHSDYGINSEIYINNSESYYTGRSGGNVGGSVNSLSTQFGSGSTSTKYNSYGYYTWLGEPISNNGTIGAITDSALGTNASTTGNVTGVYDMSGGAYEYVMGYYSGANSNYATDPDTYFGQTSSSNYAGFTSLLDSKYWDEYKNSATLTACNDGPCYGHALSETAGWYSDARNFVDADYPWFFRGGYYKNGTSTGVWSFNFYDGRALGNYVFRSTLVNGTE